MKKLRYNTQYIDAYLQKTNTTKEEFALLCGISMQELKEVYEQKNIELIIVIKIVDVLHITIDTFTLREKFYPTKKFH